MRTVILKNERGSQFIELLIVMPFLLMIFFMIVEMGFVMYDFVTVNYAAATAAVEAARAGEFSDEIRAEIGDYLKDWTTTGKTLDLDIHATAPVPEDNTIIVWGPPSGQIFQRGNTIEVGVIYPVKFKSIVVDSFCRWLVKEENITLKSRAAALSEVYFEP
jgi:Flp pilus assembly protein TadG